MKTFATGLLTFFLSLGMTLTQYLLQANIPQVCYSYLMLHLSIFLI